MRRSSVHLSRRAFVGLLAAGAAGLTAGALGLLTSQRALPRRPGLPLLDDAPTGTISAESLRTLLAATRVVVNEPIEEQHYAAFFRWRAEHLRGHRALYERFRATVDRVAKVGEGCAFAQCPDATQRRILQRAFQIRAEASTGRRVRPAEREWLLYDRHIVQEVLALFARTDVWILLGYEAWPGTSRGLEHYREAPRRKA